MSSKQLSEDSQETEKNPEKVEKTEQKENAEVNMVKKKSPSLLVSTTSVVDPDINPDPPQFKEKTKPGTNDIMSIVKNSQLNPNATSFYPKQYSQQIPTTPKPQTQSQVTHVMPQPGQQIKQPPQPKQGVSFGQTTFLGSTTSAPATGFSIGSTTQPATCLTLGGLAKTTTGPTLSGIAQAKPGFCLGGTISQPATGLGWTPESYAKGIELGGTTQTATVGYGEQPSLNTSLTIDAGEIKIGQDTSAMVSIRPQRTSTVPAPDIMAQTASCQVVQNENIDIGTVKFNFGKTRKVDNICIKEQDKQTGADGEQMQEKVWKESDEVKEVQDQERGQIKKLKRTKGGAYLTQPAGTPVTAPRHSTVSIAWKDSDEVKDVHGQEKGKIKKLKRTKGGAYLTQPAGTQVASPLHSADSIAWKESDEVTEVQDQETGQIKKLKWTKGGAYLTQPAGTQVTPPRHSTVSIGCKDSSQQQNAQIFPSINMTKQTEQKMQDKWTKRRKIVMQPFRKTNVRKTPFIQLGYMHEIESNSEVKDEKSPKSMCTLKRKYSELEEDDPVRKKDIIQMIPLQEPTEPPAEECPVQFTFNSGVKPIPAGSLLTLYTTVTTHCQFPQIRVAELMPLASVAKDSLPVTTMEIGAHHHLRTARHPPPLQSPPSSLNNQQDEDLMDWEDSKNRYLDYTEYDSEREELPPEDYLKRNDSD